MRTSPRRAAPASALKGDVVAPGDKSISHRSLILGARAEGVSAIAGLLESEDVLRTAAALRALGVRIERDRGADGPLWRVWGGPWTSPETTLYAGNSGTGARLLMGAIAGAGVSARLDGDASLRRRPMGRVLEPLSLMGAAVRSDDGLLPVSVDGSAPLLAIDYALPRPSAQIKSAILMAALGAQGAVVVRESAPSRDHTERLLAAFGGAVETETAEGGRIIRFEGGQKLKGARLTVPGDISSAAFLIAAALIVPSSDVLMRGVGVNPLRTGLLVTLAEMGAAIEIICERMVGGEPVADIRARVSTLKGVRVPADRAPSMIDEYPVLAVLAAFAQGTTRLEGLAELRVKESDRLAAIAAGLKANGVKCAAGPDWLEIEGRGPAGVPGGGIVATHLDHRIAMSFLVMGLGAEAAVEIDDDRMIATSFPGFFASLAALGAAV
ncbi:MAG: 3-phosphoshikimate 1-carboxyvinyltransferase [Parvularculaceae bacterium]